MNFKVKLKIIIGIIFHFVFIFANITLAEEPTNFQKQQRVSLQFFPLGQQFRYEETDQQSIEYRKYNHYALQSRFSKYQLGVEFNNLKYKSGNQSLNIQNDIQEWNLVLGYNLYQLDLTEIVPAAFFDIDVQGVYGKNFVLVKTSVLGNESTNRSKMHDIFGVILNGQFRFHYLVLALDTRWVYSEAYTPVSVPATTVKLGIYLETF